MLTAILVLPGLLAAYVIFVRPWLHALPAIKDFYAKADTFWGKVWAIFGKSTTIVWSVIVAVAAKLFDYIDPLATLLGAPDFKEQVLTLFKDHPEYIGYFAMVVSGVTIAARLRSIAKG